MYGEHKAPFEFERGALIISTEETEEGLNYHREYEDNIIDKTIFSKGKNIVINPIEPLNTPKVLTSTLLIEMDKPLVLEPNNKKRIYLTYPLEIGVFVKDKKQHKDIDIFTLVKNKYTLYGDVKTGTICKYWKSDLYTSKPSPDPLHLGVLELQLYNSADEWIEVTKSVFNAYGMVMFYDRELVYMRCQMKIVGENRFATQFLTKPLREDMKKSLEVFEKKLHHLKGVRFIMDGGM
ncbi:MAG: DUF432 domain-containing protein [Candidatus Saliniplasma sp.]